MAVVSKTVLKSYFESGDRPSESNYRDLIDSLQGAVSTTVFDITDYGAVGDGVTVNTSAITEALDAASAAGGGIVWVPAATAPFLSGPQTYRRNVTVEGTGEGSELKLISSANDDFWKRKDDFVRRAGMRNLKINGNLTTNVSGNGINLIRTGSAPFDTSNNPFMLFQNVWVSGFAENGVRINSVDASAIANNFYFDQVMSRGNLQDGYKIVTGADSYFRNCLAVGNEKQGFDFTGVTNVHMTDCKTFFNGASAGSGIGFGYFIGPGCKRIVMENCQAQEDYDKGIYIVSAEDIQISNGIADSNGRELTPGVGVHIKNSNRVYYQGYVGSFHSPTWQEYGVTVSGSNAVTLDLNADNNLTQNVRVISGNNIQTSVNGQQQQRNGAVVTGSAGDGFNLKFTASASAFSRFGMTSSSDAILVIDPTPSTGGGASEVRYFQNVSTSGANRFRIYRGDSTSNFNHQFNAKSDAVVCMTSGNLRVGGSATTAGNFGDGSFVLDNLGANPSGAVTGGGVLYMSTTGNLEFLGSTGNVRVLASG